MRDNLGNGIMKYLNVWNSIYEIVYANGFQKVFNNWNNSHLKLVHKLKIFIFFS